MNIVILTKDGQDAKNITLSGVFIFFVILVLFAVLITFSYSQLNLKTADSFEEQFILEFLNQQKSSINSLQRDIQSKNDNTVLKLAEIKSKLISLDILSNKLIKHAKFKTSDFDFSYKDNKSNSEEGKILINTLTENYSIVNKENLVVLDRVELELSQIFQELNYKEQQLKIIEALYDETLYLNDVNPKGKPAEKGWISSYFGNRKDPFTGKNSFHKGIDVAAKTGSKVVATATGVVTWSGKKSGYGNMVELNHGNGLVTRYGHCKTLLVKLGDKVNQGDPIATVGTTGRSTGPHVHYEVIRNNAKINPISSVRKKRG